MLSKNESNPRYTKHNYKAEKELKAIEKALLTINNNDFDTREQVVQAYNNLEQELLKINKWKSKADKKLQEVNLLAEEINKINKQIEMVNNKEQQLKDKENDFKNVMNVYDKAIRKEHEKLYKEIEASR